MNFNIFLRRSLKTRLTLFTLIIFLISIWSLVFYTGNLLRRDMQHELSDQQFSTVSLLAAEANDELEYRLEALKKISEQITSATLANPVALQTLLEQRAVFQTLFNGGTIATGIDGVVIASVPVSTGRIGVSYMEREHIAAALKEGKTSISKPLIGKTSMTPVFGMVTPIRDFEGKVIGALVGVIELSKHNFIDLITQSRYGKTGDYFLVAPQYRLIVTSSDKMRIMQQFPAPGINPSLDRFLQGYEGSAVYVNPFGIEVLGSAKSIPVAGWYMDAILPTAEAFAPIHAMQQHMILSTILVTLLAGGLTWWILSRQLAPMLVAARILDTQSDANQPMKPLPITNPDEIGRLIGGFNHLLETLTQREEALLDNQQRLAFIVQFLPDATMAINKEKRVIIWNKAIEEMTGIPASDMIGKGDYAYSIPFYGKAQPQLMDLIFEDHEDIADLYPNLTREGDTLTAEIFASSLNNKGAWVFLKAAPLHDSSGNIIGAIESIRDITELKLANELLKSQFENSPDIIQIIDRNFKIEAINKIVSGNFSFENIKGMDSISLLPSEHQDFVRENINKCFETGTIREFEHSIGDGQWVHARVVPMINERKIFRAMIISTNITRQRRAEAELLEYSQRMKLATASGRLGIWDWNVEKNVMVWDDRMFELYGVSRDTFPHTVDAWTNGLHPDDKQRAIDESNAALEGVKGFDTIFRVLHPDSTVKYLKADGMVIRDHDGKAVRMIGINRDVTASIQAEKELAKSRRLIDSVISQTTDAIYVKDSNGLYLLFNNGAETLTGIPASDILGKDDFFLFVPEGAKTVIEYDRMIMEMGRPKTTEETVISPNGKKRTYLSTKGPMFDEEGNVVGIIGISRDISERKEMEEEIRRSRDELEILVQERTDELTKTVDVLKEQAELLDFAYDAIFVRDSDGIIRYWNSGAEKTYGWTREEALGEKSHDLLKTQFPISMEDTVSCALDTGQWEGELNHITKNGMSIIAASRWVVHKNHEGAILGFLVINRDITERKKFAEERERLIDNLQEALANVKLLSGMLPICASCKKIRDDKGYWNQIESYISYHSEAQFSHGICPDCARKLYPDLGLDFGPMLKK